MRKENRYRAVLEHFQKLMPEVTTELEFSSVFQLLVAVILSAQCTDKRINQVTPELFSRFPDARHMAEAEADEIYEYIRSVSYPNSKARHLVEMARALVEKHDGEVPQDMDQLLTLPGVGRKTANVIPDELIPRAHHWLLLHGRYVCTSQRPKCKTCQLADICPKLLEGSKLE